MIGGAGFVHNGGCGRRDPCNVLQKESSRTAIVGVVQDVEEESGPLAIETRTPACE